MATYTFHDSHSSHTVHARDDAAALRAAARWARNGSYDEDALQSTIWIAVRVERHRRGGFREPVDTITAAIDPVPPPCRKGSVHDWRILPVRRAGRVHWSECRLCEVRRRTDMNATRPDTGTSGHRSVRYTPAPRFHDELCNCEFCR